MTEDSFTSCKRFFFCFPGFMLSLSRALALLPTLLPTLPTRGRQGCP